jgi:hypothetical protein
MGQFAHFTHAVLLEFVPAHPLEEKCANEGMCGNPRVRERRFVTE